MLQARFTRFCASYLAIFVAAVIAVAPTPGRAQAVEVELDNGETIWLDGAVVDTCRGEGMNLGACACACVVQIMLDEERVSQMTLTEMTRLANAYPAEYQAARAECFAINR